jgi:hypothetical protein
MIKKFPFFQEFIANDIEHAKKIILRLVRDYDYYQECKKMISEIGEMYHMEHSYDAYVTQINKMFGINIDNSLL